MHEEQDITNKGFNQSGTGAIGIVKSEVNAERKRRTFTSEYKLKILTELDRCSTVAQRGAVLRKEGLFSSSVSDWRQQRAQGALSALSPKRGRPAAAPASQDALKLAALERENASLQRRLAQAEAIIEVQKKVSEIFGITLQKPQSSDAE